MNVRRPLVAVSTAFVAVLATTVPASAVTPSCDDPAALQTWVTEATAALGAARTAFHAANRPLGALISANRHQARVDLTSSRTELRALVEQARSADGRAELTALRGQIRADRRAIAHDRSLLDTKRAVLAQIKADRVAARSALRAARADLVALRAVQDSCGTDTTDTTDTPTP